MAALRSAALKKRALRNLAKTQRSANKTDCRLSPCPAACGPGRKNRRAIMVGQFEIAAVQAGFIAIRIGDGGFQMSQTTNFGAPPRKAKRSTCAPIQSAIFSLAGPGRNVVRAPSRRRKLHRPHFAGYGVNDIDRITSEIDEYLLAGDVGWRIVGRMRFLGGVALAKPTVAVAIGMGGAIFLPSSARMTPRRRSSFSTDGQSGTGRAAPAGDGAGETAIAPASHHPDVAMASKAPPGGRAGDSCHAPC